MTHKMPHKIVILDGYTLNPGDLSWDIFAPFGEVKVYSRPQPEQLIERAKEATILIINKAVITAEILQQLPNLQLICVSATGYNVIDLEATRKRNIPVCNVPAYGTAAVAQHTFALLLELCNKVGLHSESVQNQEWAQNIDWCYWKTPIVELSGKTLGIVGFGKIGQKTAEIGQAFGLKILANTQNPTHKNAPNVTFTDLETVFQESDFVSLHCALTESNFRFVNQKLLSQMKPSAFLINTGRGDLIEEKDLVEVLKNQKITGAGLDVLSQEPPSENHPLTQLENCIITPHNAWASREARFRLLDTVRTNIGTFLEGKLQNVVNGVQFETN